MAALERVMEMKGQGMPDSDIIDALRQEGISPREINEALSQSQIKYAVDGTQEMDQQTPESAMQEGYSKSSFQEYSEAPSPDSGEAMQMQPPTQEYYPEYQPQQGGYQEYQQQQPFDIETISEMIEQSIEEKNDVLKKQISSFTKFREDSMIQIEQMNARLQKIENTITDLQMSIIRKVGEYGQDIHTIAREMQETQNTFSKIVNPLTDSIQELRSLSDSMTGHHRASAPSQHEPQSKTHETQEHHRGKTKSDFEQFLR